jgi:hypothetical protein
MRTLLFLFIFRIIMANISSDVEYLRQQYNAEKSKGTGFVVQYNNKQFQDGDELKKSDTQTAPRVQNNIETDSQYPFFTLVNFRICFLFPPCLSFYYLGYGRSGCS